MQRIAREHARQQRQAELARQRQAREQVRVQREQLRIHAQLDRQHRERYLESRAAEAEEMTSEVHATMDTLGGILEAGLDANPFGYPKRFRDLSRRETLGLRTFRRSRKTSQDL
jgi:multidrug efflux pump subunit AcrA (membrane-fusion protein)